MKPATWPRGQPLDERLLCIEPHSGRLKDQWIRQLPSLLNDGDLLVVNDAATLPASLQAKRSSGEPIEVRLAGRGNRDSEWTAVLLGRGDWRMRTEDRPAPPLLARGEVLHFGDDLTASVRRVWSVSPRLVDLTFDREGEALWEAVYRYGRPIQYSHLKSALTLWHVQTAYGARPWAVQTPSAGRPLNWELLGALRQQGVGLASLTHAAGLSSTGDAAVDALFPLPERFDIPASTVEAIEKTRHRQGLVIAVGTSVVRALEGSAAAHSDRLKAGPDITDLRITEHFQPRVVDGLLTGLHERGTSHFMLLTAFVPESVLLAAYRHAETRDYLGHEFGDMILILGSRRSPTGGERCDTIQNLRSPPTVHAGFSGTRPSPAFGEKVGASCNTSSGIGSAGIVDDQTRPRSNSMER